MHQMREELFHEMLAAAHIYSVQKKPHTEAPLDLLTEFIAEEDAETETILLYRN